jgi:predicted PolB exonuclease-like 3'-5' exonuclease
VPQFDPKNNSVIVWDIETVPDLQGFAAANYLVGKSDVEIQEAMGDKFPKHIYHSIVCIGALVAHHENDHWAVDALGTPHVGDRSEKELIQAFVDKIAQLNPQLVTFNGNSFDLPVLRYRAMINGVAAPGLSARPYFNRYTSLQAVARARISIAGRRVRPEPPRGWFDSAFRFGPEWSHTL